MRKFFTIDLIFFIVFSHSLYGQTIADMEAFNLPPESHIENAGEEQGFINGNVLLVNEYDPEFMTWAGWAISNTTDTLTPGYINQYSAIAGRGVNGSQHYAVSTVGYDFRGATLVLQDEAAGGVVEGMYVTNNTYAFLSMRDGDSFSKKFGGETGEDPDWFLISIRKYLNGQISQDSIVFYLADFRSDTSSLDYIIDEWTWVDLRSLGNADSLYFQLYSSDVGAFGMNTPAFFCVDDITTKDMISSNAGPEGMLSLEIFPNPVATHISIHSEAEGERRLSIYNAAGQLCLFRMGKEASGRIDLSGLADGVYFLRIVAGGAFGVQTFVKNASQ